ncbi:response regulator [Nocardioides sp.]|uniref:response regulator n=1 Tax=Nocardioides sp. TaxID=35761 RepID=UPI003528919E
MGHTVLVVDDEPGIRDVLRAYLTDAGLRVLEAATGADALDRATAETVDLLLLDLGLPDIDGLEVLRRLRSDGDPGVSGVYVVLVTARAEEVDKIVGLGVGADDYVTKPFSPREVVARVQAALRRLGASAAPVGESEALTFERITIDQARREITVDGRPVSLTTLDFDLLAALASSPGRVFSRAQLLEHVWGYDFFGDERVVDVHIRAMRKALGDDATDPWIIGTVRGVGYKFLPGRGRP